MNDRALRRLVGGLALLGIAIAGYLTWVHYAGIEPICAASGDCERVQNSTYAEVAGVPVAVLGLVGYVVIAATLAIPGETGRMVGAFLACLGLGFSAYLTYLELFVIEAICQWCIASALVMAALLAGTVTRVFRGDRNEADRLRDRL